MTTPSINLDDFSNVREAKGGKKGKRQSGKNNWEESGDEGNKDGGAGEENGGGGDGGSNGAGGFGGHDYEHVTDAATPTLAIELDSKASPAEMQAESQRRPPVEMPAPMVPVELPAEVPSGLLPPDRCQSLVSDLTMDSRASSPERFPVSPAAPTRRTSLWKG